MDFRVLTERVVLTVALLIALAASFVLSMLTAVEGGLTSYHDDPSCGEDDVSDRPDGDVCECARRSDAKWSSAKSGPQGICEGGTVKSGKCVCAGNDLPWTGYVFVIMNVIIICVLARLLYKSFVVNST